MVIAVGCPVACSDEVATRGDSADAAATPTMDGAGAGREQDAAFVSGMPDALPDDGLPTDASRGDAAPAVGLDAAAGDASGMPTPDAVVEPPTPDAAVEPPTPDAVFEPPTPDAVVEPPTPDAAVVEPPTPDAAVEPPTPDAAVEPPTPDAAVPPTPDAAVPPPSPPPIECAPHTPVMIYGYLATPGPTGLYVTDLNPLGAEPAPTVRVFDLAEGERPLGMAASPAAVGDASLFFAFRDDAGCRLVGLDPVAGLRWQSVGADVLDCGTPAVSGAGVLWPVVTAAGPALRVLDPATGAPTDNVPLPVAPTGAPAALGDDRLENGGSHWLVAGDGAVVVVGGLAGGEAPAVLGVEPLPGQVTAVGAASGEAGQTVVALWKSDPSIEGFGDHAARFDVGPGVTLAPRPDMVLASPARTGPLVADDCIDPLANGGSHWWCPGGLLAVGTDGALALWDLTTGEPRASVALGDDTRPTGLTLGGDDRIFNGGSHWRGGGQGQWSVRAIDPVTGVLTTLDGGPAPLGTCVAAPVIDTDGLLAAVRFEDGGPPNVLRRFTDARGLGHGFARPGGDNLGRGIESRRGDACTGADAPLFAAPLPSLPGLSVVDALSLPDGSRVLAGAQITLPNEPSYVARLSAAGDLLWFVPFPTLPGTSNPLVSLGSDGVEILAIGNFFDQLAATVRPRVVHLDLNGGVLSDQLIEDGQQRNGRLIAPRDGGGAWAVITNSDGNGFQIAELNLAGIAINRFLVSVNREFEVRDFERIPAGFVLVGSESRIPTRDALVVITDQTGMVVDFDRLPPPDDNQAMAYERLAVGPDGGFLVAGERFALVGGAITYFVRAFDANLDLVGESELPGIDRIAGVAFGGRQDGWLLSQDFQLIRLTNKGAAGPPRRLVAGPGAFGVALGVALDGSPEISGHVLLSDGMTRTPWAARADLDGRLGCGAAGRCTVQAAAACGDDDPCTFERCVPATGGCEAVPVADGAPCGVGLTCNAGVCR